MSDFPPMSARVPYEDGTTMTQALLDDAYSMVLSTNGAGLTDHIIGLPAGNGGAYVVSGQLYMAWNCSYINGLWTPFSAGQPSWLMGYGADSIVISRAPAGSTTFVPIMTIPNNGGLILPDGTRLSSAKLSGLSDTNIAAPLNGQSLVWNSTLNMWQNGSPSGGSLATLTDVALSSQTNGQVLSWNSATSRWVNANATSNTLAGLTDCNVAGPLTGQVLAWSGSHWQNTASGASIPIKFVAPTGGDDTAQINAALAANQLVVLAPGDYQISSGSINAFQANAALIGLGVAVTRLHVVIAALDGIVVPATCTQYLIGGFTIDRTLAATGSATGINASALTKASSGIFRDIISSKHIVGMSLGAALYSTCRDVQCTNNISDGFVMMPPTTSDALLQWNMMNCNAQTNGGWGFRVKSGTFTAATLIPFLPWANCKTLSNTLGGIGFLGTPNGQLDNIILLGGEFNGDNADILYFDTYGTNNYILDVFTENAGQTNTGYSPSTPATGVGSGIHITANNGLTRIDGGGSEFNSKHGILLDNAIATVTNHAAYNNSYQTVNTCDGINASAVGATIILTSNQCKNYGTSLQGNKSSQRYGVWLADGTNASLTSNGLAGNASGAAFVNTNGTLLNAFGNQGYASQSGGPLSLPGNAASALQAIPLQQLNSVVAGYVPLAGGIMTGALTLSGNAGSNLNPVPLQQLNSALGNYVPLAGGVMTGALTLNGNAGGNLNPVPLQQMNSALGGYLPLGGGTITGNLTVNGYTSIGNGAGVSNGFTVNSGNLNINTANASLYWTGSANPYIMGDGNGMLRLAATSQIQINSPMLWPLNDNTTNLGWSGNRWIWVFAVNGAINTSDRNEKRNIKPTDLGLEFIEHLHPVSYEWIESYNAPGTHYGFIAQDIEDVLDGKDFAGIVKPKEDGEHYSLAYHEIIAPLVKAVQELSAKVAELERRLAT